MFAVHLQSLHICRYARVTAEHLERIGKVIRRDSKVLLASRNAYLAVLLATTLGKNGRVDFLTTDLGNDEHEKRIESCAKRLITENRLRIFDMPDSYDVVVCSEIDCAVDVIKTLIGEETKIFDHLANK